MLPVWFTGAECGRSVIKKHYDWECAFIRSGVRPGGVAG